MSWENVIKVEREESPIRTTTIGDEPTADDFLDVSDMKFDSIPEFVNTIINDFEKIQDSFLKDLEELLPDDLKFDSMPEKVDEIEGIFDEMLNLEMLMYKKITRNKKIEYLTDLKNKIVDDLYFDRSGIPSPSGELLIVRERPNIQETLYKPDPRDPEGLATIPDQQAAVISDRFADEAEEFRNEAVSKISRILTPFFEDTSIEPVEDDSVPRQEPQAVTGAKPFNFKNVHGDLSRMFGKSIKIDNAGNPVITSLAIKKFEEIIQKEMAKVTGEDSKTPSVSKLPSNTTGKFKNVNRSDKVKFSSVDYFFNKLAQEKQNKTEIDKLFREDIVGLDMSMYRVLVKLYLVNYKNTAVSNLPAILGKKSKEPQKEKEPVTFTIEFAGQQFDPTKPEDIKALQELASSPTGKEEDQRIRQERAKQIRENIDTINELIEEINEPVSEAQSLQNLISELSENNLISFTDDKKIDINNNEALQRLQRLEELNVKLKPEFGEQEQDMASRIRGTRLPKRAKITAPSRKKLTEEEQTQFKEKLTSLLETGPLTPEETQELRESLLDPNKIPKMKPKYLTQEQYQDIEEQLKDSRNANRKLNAAKRAKAQGRDVKLTRAEIRDLENKVLSQKEKTELNNKIKSHLQALVILGSTGGKKRPRNIEETLPKEEIESRKRTYIRDVIDPMSSLRESAEEQRKKNKEETGLSETDAERERRERTEGKGIYPLVRQPSFPLTETKKALDDLLIQLGVTSDTIVKEDTGVILSELNKKDRRLVKTLLQLAHPTEYFNEDVLKLGELITVLKSLGVVNENKGLKKRILKYEDENLMVVKRAVKLRREYEKLYKSIREVIYPKTGDDNE